VRAVARGEWDAQATLSIWECPKPRVSWQRSSSGVQSGRGPAVQGSFYQRGGLTPDRPTGCDGPKKDGYRTIAGLCAPLTNGWVRDYEREELTISCKLRFLNESDGSPARRFRDLTHSGGSRGLGCLLSLGVWSRSGDPRAIGPTMYGCAGNREPEVQRARRAEVVRPSNDPVRLGHEPATARS